jgi:DNA-binding transcriptional MerR regulator
MRWSTAEVALLSPVSSRTQRRSADSVWDHVGLLRPARTGYGGLRYYERPQLLRLQHILVLRELGLGLDDIGAVLDGETDEVAALRRHHDRFLAEAERLRTLAATVARTIEEREDGPEMAAEELFEGFRNDPYAAEARERYGEVAVEAQARAASWDDDTARGIKEEGDAVNRDAAALLQAGVPVDDPRVQDVIARHHAWVSHFWTPGRDAYIGLGRLYVDDERFTATIDAAAPGLAAYLRDAMAVYANARLS